MKDYLAFVVGGIAVIVALLICPSRFPDLPKELPAFSTPGANKYQIAQEETVLVKVDDGFGSGVVVHRQSTNGIRTFVLTAKHVVEDRGTNAVTVKRVIHFSANSKFELEFPAKVIWTSTNDWALLWVDAPVEAFRGAVFYDDAPLTIGDSLFAVGTPYQFDNTVTRGMLTLRGLKVGRWPVVDETDVRFAPGSSGGPVFNSDGLVVGLAVGRVPDSGINFFVPVRAMVDGEMKWALWGSECPSDKILNWLAEINQPKAEPAAEVLPNTPPVAPQSAPSKPGFWKRLLKL